MTNLLPSQFLRKTQRFNRGRFVLVGSITSIICSLFALLALVPPYLAVRATAPGEMAQAAPPPLLDNSDREDIARAKGLLTELKPLVASTSSVLTSFAAALATRPSGIRVSRMRYVQGDPDSIVIEGTSRTRDDINTYRTTLSVDPHFKDVSVPIGSLAGIEGGHFTVTLTGDF